MRIINRPFNVSLGFSILGFLFCSYTYATPNFTAQGGVILSTALPQVVDTSTSPYRLYFLRGGYDIHSATSTDGFFWSEESGVRLSTSTTPQLIISSITGCSLLPLTAGGYRMLYSMQPSSGNWAIASATSTDGLSWTNESVRINVTSGTFIGFPRLLKLSNGDWRIYYLRDINGGNDAVDRQVFTDVSTDEGVTWSTSTLILAEQSGELGIATRTDKRVRLFVTQPLTSETTNSVLISALSSDANGTSFTKETGIRLSTGSTTGTLSFPTVFRSTENFRFRLLYGFTSAGISTTNIHTALTINPDPQSMSPSQVIRTDPNRSFTISGEVFDSTPTAHLSLSGQSNITGTSLTRDSDQSITTTFATNGQAIGLWALTVTNSDALEGTLTSGLTITFAAGQITMIDNLLRPRNGAKTQIDITTYQEGRLKLDLYTLDGKMVNAIFEGDVPAGTSTYYWDGKTADGNTVASGTYLLRITGPKINEVEKIVVIR